MPRTGPVIVDRGPVEFSTGTALQPRPKGHDAAGYYRELGVAPDASRAELIAAYRARRGQDDPRLTYVLRQLLDRSVRARYDVAPAGSWLDDYARQAVLRSPDGALLASSNLMWQGGGTASRQDAGRRYGYYLWRVRDVSDETLSDWQSMLVRALSSRGQVRTIAIGIRTGRTPVVEATVIGGVTVCWLHARTPPTDELAAQMADLLTSS